MISIIRMKMMLLFRKNLLKKQKQSFKIHISMIQVSTKLTHENIQHKAQQ